MKERPDLNKLAKEVFEANKAKGFHDEERSNETLLMLVITELSEAVEADRKNKRAKLERYNRKQESRNPLSDLPRTRAFQADFEQTIKDTVEDELADAVIRLLDLAGLREMPIQYELNIGEDKKLSYKEKRFEFAEIIFNITSCIFESRWKMNKLLLFDIISSVIRAIDAYCVLNSIDLWQHVELKLKYNATRPHKHGKKY
ncbi:hypothetical protein [Dysgonomonas massiliensis]|uniref:hypothetical protein n=1 Tax=Dysgonomonas massiliensis TaxID=2040292 RepID=UPI000C75E38C|nr:hypothetical protein [Dysgonomonas massiliensis]